MLNTVVFEKVGTSTLHLPHVPPSKIVIRSSDWKRQSNISNGFFSEKNSSSNDCSYSWNHDKADEFLKWWSVNSIWLSPCFLCSFSIVFWMKLLSHDLNAFWCVRLLSRDAKSLLNVAMFMKTAVIHAETRPIQSPRSLTYDLRKFEQWGIVGWVSRSAGGGWKNHFDTPLRKIPRSFKMSFKLKLCSFVSVPSLWNDLL